MYKSSITTYLIYYLLLIKKYLYKLFQVLCLCRPLIIVSVFTLESFSQITVINQYIKCFRLCLQKYMNYSILNI